MLPIHPPLVPNDVFFYDGYRIEHWRHDTKDGDTIGRVLVKNKRGKVIVQAHNFNVWAYELDDHIRHTVVLREWTGGAHASYGYYVIQLKPKPECILAYWKGNTTEELDLEPKDLDHDGIPELTSYYDGFSYRLGRGFCPVYIPLVFKKEHGRYVEATTRYRKFLRKNALIFLEQLQQTPEPGVTGPTRASAVGFISIKRMLGEEAQAWRIVKQKVNANEYNILWERRKFIDNVIDDRIHWVSYPRLGQIPLSWKQLNSDELDHRFRKLFGAKAKTFESE